jgi:hypothetical protein
MRVTKRDWLRRAPGRRTGFARDVVTLLLLRWIAVAAVLLGIAALASGEESTASSLDVDTRGTQPTAGSAR